MMYHFAFKPIYMMLAMNYRGPYRVRASRKPYPEIEHPMDAIIRVTRSCICGSDLHIYHGKEIGALLVRKLQQI